MAPAKTKPAIKPSSDRKVRCRPSQKNTFGLMPGRGGTCPASTRGCGGCESPEPGRKTPTCYVFPLMRAYKGVEGVLQNNTDLLMNSDIPTMTQLLVDEFNRFLRLEKRARKTNMAYRLHWSGDIFSKDYATALTAAMREFPEIRFWCYTRSFPYGVKLARENGNLSMYLSLDPVNAYAGLRAYFDAMSGVHGELAGTLRIAYMAPENNFDETYIKALSLHKTLQIADRQEHGRMLHDDWPEDPVKLKPCPVDEGWMPLEGGCSSCHLCFRGNPAHVFFRT